MNACNGPYEAFPRQERSPASLQRIANGLWRDVATALSSNASMRSIYAAKIDFKEATRRLQQARENRHEGGFSALYRDTGVRWAAGDPPRDSGLARAAYV